MRTIVVVEHNIGDDAVITRLFQQVVRRSVWNTHVELRDNAFHPQISKLPNVVIQAQAVNVTDGEVTLQADAMNGNARLLQASGKIVECLCLGFSLELHAVVIEVEHGVGISTVGIDESRVDEVLADSQRPNTLPQFIGIGICSDD